jgi:hypothetical protein
MFNEKMLSTFFKMMNEKVVNKYFSESSGGKDDNGL